MEVECRFFGPFREGVGEKTISYETDATDCGQLLRELEQEFSELDGHLVSDDGLAGGVAITVDREDIRHQGGLSVSLDDGAVVRLTPSIHGG